MSREDRQADLVFVTLARALPVTPLIIPLSHSPPPPQDKMFQDDALSRFLCTFFVGYLTVDTFYGFLHFPSESESNPRVHAHTHTRAHTHTNRLMQT